MRVSKTSLKRFIAAAFSVHNLDAAQMASVTDNLVWCDLVGRHNHGVERLPILMKRLEHGLISTPCTPEFNKLSTSVGRLDGNNGFGHYVAATAMQHAIDLARGAGIGAVGVNNSNFLGAAGYYAHLAAEQGMISLVMSNSFPKVAAVDGVKAVLGTNPLAFGAPRKNGKALIVDMSTASVAGSTIRQAIKTGEKLPEGTAIDASGQPIVDPSQLNQGALLPAAGGKGFGLALMVEILAGVVTNAGMSHEIGSMYADFDRGGANGHFMLAIDIEKWMPMTEYHARFETLARTVLGGSDVNPTRLPGMARWECYKDNLANGIPLEASTHEALDAMASTYNIQTLQ